MREMVDWKKEERILSFHFSLESEFLPDWAAGWPSTSCNVPTFIRFLASNVREEIWSASIVRNERDFLRWNGWPSRNHQIFETMIYRICFFVIVSSWWKRKRKSSFLKRVSNFRSSFCLIQCHSISLTYSLFDLELFLGFVWAKEFAYWFIKKIK